MWDGMTSGIYGIIAAIIVASFMCLLQIVKHALWKLVRKKELKEKQPDNDKIFR